MSVAILRRKYRFVFSFFVFSSCVGCCLELVVHFYILPVILAFNNCPSSSVIHNHHLFSSLDLFLCYSIVHLLLWFSHLLAFFRIVDRLSPTAVITLTFVLCADLVGISIVCVVRSKRLWNRSVSFFKVVVAIAVVYARSCQRLHIEKRQTVAIPSISHARIHYVGHLVGFANS